MEMTTPSPSCISIHVLQLQEAGGELHLPRQALAEAAPSAEHIVSLVERTRPHARQYSGPTPGSWPWVDKTAAARPWRAFSLGCKAADAIILSKHNCGIIKMRHGKSSQWITWRWAHASITSVTYHFCMTAIGRIMQYALVGALSQACYEQ